MRRSLWGHHALWFKVSVIGCLLILWGGTFDTVLDSWFHLPIPRFFLHRLHPLIALSAIGYLFFLFWRREVQILRDRDKQLHDTIVGRESAEAALRDNERLLRDVINAIPDLVILKDPEGRWLKANQAALDLYGIAGMPYEGLTGPEIARFSDTYKRVYADFRAALDKVSQDASPGRSEEVIPLPEDHAVFDVSRIPLLTDEQKCRAIVVVGRDITARKRVESELRESEQRYRSLFENNGDGIFAFDTDGVCLSVNARAAEILGYGPELVGRSYVDMVPPEKLAALEELLARFEIGTCPEIIMTALHKDGYPRELFIKMVPIVIDEQMTGVYAIVRDITDHQQALQEIERLHRQHESILNSAAEGIHGVDLNGRLTFCNPALLQMTGYQLQELLGQTIHPILHHSHANGDPYPLEECPMHQALQDGKVSTLPNELLWRKDGTFIPVEYMTSPIMEHGRITGAVVATRDITERRKAEDFFLQSEKLSLAGQLAAGLAHEIRNPLTVLMGFIQLMRATSSDENPHLPIMLSEIKRIESILKEFLVLAKPTPDSFDIVDPGVLMDNLLSLLSAQATMHNVMLQGDWPSTLPFIRCDENRLKQVFINLIKNAIEAMPQGGAIAVRIREDGPDLLCIRVEDQGCGIPQEALRRLGEPFYTTKSSGTGLGLMVCYRIVQTHGGTLYIDSEVGRGTVVEVRLPTTLSAHRPLQSLHEQGM